MKKTPEELKKIADEATSDKNQALWEEGKLGKDPKHAEIYKGKSLFEKSYPTSIRLTKSMIEELKKLSNDIGIGYQSYLKMIIQNHLDEKRKAG